MDLFSMGMFCLDEIHFPERSYTNVIGGAGTYAVLGAAVLVPLEERKSIGFICDQGRDFSKDLEETIKSWGLRVLFRRDDARETTKAWNKFVHNEERLFKYLSPKRQIFAEDMPEDAREAAAIHLVCSPARCRDFLTTLRATTRRTDSLYIWEPVPTECNPGQFELLKSVVINCNVSVLSPNALEAAALVGLQEPTTQDEVERLVNDYYNFADTMVVRCGSTGSYLKTGSFRKWYPPFFSVEQRDRVVDPSGAGNGFLGGLSLALARKLDWDTVLAYANVAASFMIEQVGPPNYDRDADHWNGDCGYMRVAHYLEKNKTNSAPGNA